MNLDENLDEVFDAFPGYRGFPKDNLDVTSMKTSMRFSIRFRAIEVIGDSGLYNT